MKLNCDSEKLIYEGLKSNQHQAIECLYTKYFLSSTLAIYKRGGNMADRKDVFQEAVVVFMKKIQTDKYEFIEKKMGAYLSRIVLLVWFANKRKNRSVPLKAEFAEQLSFAGDDDIYQIFEAEEQQKQYKKILSLLTGKCKDIILKRYEDQLSEKELAEKWNFGSTTALQVARSRCIKNLRTQVHLKSA